MPSEGLKLGRFQFGKALLGYSQLARFLLGMV